MIPRSNEILAIAENKEFLKDHALSPPRSVCREFSVSLLLMRKCSAERTALTPAITFAPFHPDLIYILDNSEPLHGFIFGPLGPYHSALSLFAYRLGIERSRYRGGRGEVA